MKLLMSFCIQKELSTIEGILNDKYKKNEREIK